MHKHDFRYQRADCQIRQALWKLLKKNNFRSITVKKIIACAGVTKATFYHHYTDKYDLVEKMQDQLLRDYEAALVQRKKEILAHVSTVENLQNTILQLLQNSLPLSQIQVGKLNFQERVNQMVTQLFLEVLQQLDCQLVNPKLTAKLYSNLIMAYIWELIKTGQHPSFAEECQQLRDVSTVLAKLYDKT